MPCPDKAYVFAASSVENEEQARQEVKVWAQDEGYGAPQARRVFTVFRPDASPREWALLERRSTPN